MLELCEVSISIVLRNDHPRYRPNMLLNLSSSLSITIVFVFCPLAYASLFVNTLPIICYLFAVVMI